MPQLDTCTWLTIIMTMLPTLFLVMQLKLLNTNYYSHPLQKSPSTQTYDNPSQLKWTKIYLLHLPLRQS